uniref:DNA-directed RNA polymerase subunit beta' n=1 Tax=Hazenia capsulata TaxID=2202518 RepID=A0A1W6EHM3_9CHLO|nr:beta' subunit of RNA polymerase [Hazenia capsulata]ARK14873.1 beta' subunit of RNA polymerase [Hazenia capsulata]
MSLKKKKSVTPLFKIIKENLPAAENKLKKLHSFRIGLASPRRIKYWAERTLSNGEIVGKIKNAQTVNYKTLKPEKGGLFCERIFGPVKDFYCACGKQSTKQNPKSCPICGVSFISSQSRRYKMGYIELAAPVTHIWYLKNSPSYLSILLNLKRKKLEAITYCSESFSSNVKSFKHDLVFQNFWPLLKSTPFMLENGLKIPKFFIFTKNWSNFIFSSSFFVIKKNGGGLNSKLKDFPFFLITKNEELKEKWFLQTADLKTYSKKKQNILLTVPKQKSTTKLKFCFKLFVLKTVSFGPFIFKNQMKIFKPKFKLFTFHPYTFGARFQPKGEKKELTTFNLGKQSSRGKGLDFFPTRKSKVGIFDSYQKLKVAGWNSIDSVLQNTYKGEKHEKQTYEENTRKKVFFKLRLMSNMTLINYMNENWSLSNLNSYFKTFAKPQNAFLRSQVLLDFYTKNKDAEFKISRLDLLYQNLIIQDSFRTGQPGINIKNLNSLDFWSFSKFKNRHYLPSQALFCKPKPFFLSSTSSFSFTLAPLMQKKSLTTTIFDEGENFFPTAFAFHQRWKGKSFLQNEKSSFSGKVRTQRSNFVGSALQGKEQNLQIKTTLLSKGKSFFFIFNKNSKKFFSLMNYQKLFKTLDTKNFLFFSQKQRKPSFFESVNDQDYLLLTSKSSLNKNSLGLGFEIQANLLSHPFLLSDSGQKQNGFFFKRFFLTSPFCEEENGKNSDSKNVNVSFAPKVSATFPLDKNLQLKLYQGVRLFPLSPHPLPENLLFDHSKQLSDQDSSETEKATTLLVKEKKVVRKPLALICSFITTKTHSIFKNFPVLTLNGEAKRSSRRLKIFNISRGLPNLVPYKHGTESQKGFELIPNLVSSQTFKKSNEELKWVAPNLKTHFSKFDINEQKWLYKKPFANIDFFLFSEIEKQELKTFLCICSEAKTNRLLLKKFYIGKSKQRNGILTSYHQRNIKQNKVVFKSPTLSQRDLSWQSFITSNHFSKLTKNKQKLFLKNPLGNLNFRKFFGFNLSSSFKRAFLIYQIKKLKKKNFWFKTSYAIETSSINTCKKKVIKKNLNWRVSFSQKPPVYDFESFFSLAPCFSKKKLTVSMFSKKTKYKKNLHPLVKNESFLNNYQSKHILKIILKNIFDPFLINFSYNSNDYLSSTRYQASFFDLNRFEKNKKLAGPLFRPLPFLDIDFFPILPVQKKFYNLNSFFILNSNKSYFGDFILWPTIKTDKPLSFKASAFFTLTKHKKFTINLRFFIFPLHDKPKIETFHLLIPKVRQNNDKLKLPTFSAVDKSKGFSEIFFLHGKAASFLTLLARPYKTKALLSIGKIEQGHQSDVSNTATRKIERSLSNTTSPTINANLLLKGSKNLVVFTFCQQRKVFLLFANFNQNTKIKKFKSLFHEEEANSNKLNKKKMTVKPGKFDSSISFLFSISEKDLNFGAEQKNRNEKQSYLISKNQGVGIKILEDNPFKKKKMYNFKDFCTLKQPEQTWDSKKQKRFIFKLKKSLFYIKPVVLNNYYTVSYTFSWLVGKPHWTFFLNYMAPLSKKEDSFIPSYLERSLSFDSVRTSAGAIKDLLRLFNPIGEKPPMDLLSKQIEVNILKLNETIKEVEEVFKFKIPVMTHFLFKTPYFYHVVTLIETTYIQLVRLRGLRVNAIRRLKHIRPFKESSKFSLPYWMILSVLPVLPPALRPIIQLDSQQVAVSDLNKFYQTILFRNKRVKRFLKNDYLLNTHSEMRYAQRLLQEAVDALIENGKGNSIAVTASNSRPLKSLSDMLKGKKGRFRQNLLGKRVDYSGRSVIVVGPQLKLHECGLPKEMAIELFQPFLIRRLIFKKLARNFISAKKFLKSSNAKVIWNILKEVMENRPILLNRAPTLHRLGIQAFQPKLISGKAILLHPLVCAAFNADFDGDQMAVHIPLSVQACAEAWKLMGARNHLLSSATGEPMLLPSQDMVLGCYYLTTLDVLKTKEKIKKTLNKNLPAFPYFSRTLKPIKKQDLVVNDKLNKFQRLPLIFDQNFKLRKKRFSKQTENLHLLRASHFSRYYFSNCDQVLQSFNQELIHLHSQIWLRWNGYFEFGVKRESALEIRLDKSGNCIFIYQNYQNYVNSKLEKNVFYLKTTPGRVLMNQLIFETLKQPSFKSPALFSNFSPL